MTTAERVFDSAKFKILDAEAALVRAQGQSRMMAVALKQVALGELREAAEAIQKAQRALEQEIFGKIE